MKMEENHFHRVFIKSEGGSSGSLLSIESPVLQKENGPLQKDIEEQLNLIMKTENNEEFFTSHHNAYQYNKENGFNDPKDDIEFQKRQIIVNETTVYKCQECEEVLTTFLEFKLHRKDHSVERRTCKVCYTLFQGISKLKEHMNVHNGTRPFKCKTCKKDFISSSHLKSHMLCHAKTFHFECEKCGKSFKTKRSLRGHMDTHAKKIKDYICSICKQEFVLGSEYRRHLKNHGTEAPQPKCSICNEVFKNETQLETHLTTHKDLKFPCEYCHKIFSSMYKIKKHVKRTHVENECDICSKVFYDKAEFSRHKKVEHVEEKPSICKFCDKSYEKPKNLTEHIRIQHTNDGQENKCNICDKKFINRFLLNNHIKTHDKNFRCPSCNMLFSSRYNLELHSVTHTKERKYKCSICFNGYATKTGLKNHMACHSDERPFKCTECGKFFKNNRRLYVHKMCHVTELKFECFHCGNKFKSKDYLKAHLYKHAKVKPFECSRCPKRFKHKKTLEKHLLKKHKVRSYHSQQINIDNDERAQVSEVEHENMTSDDNLKTNVIVASEKEINGKDNFKFKVEKSVKQEKIEDELPIAHFVKVKLEEEED